MGADDELTFVDGHPNATFAAFPRALVSHGTPRSPAAGRGIILLQSQNSGAGPERSKEEIQRPGLGSPP
jgi:hypothetical protein